MHRHLPSLLAVVALVSLTLPSSSQSYQPKAIRFTGAPEYTDQELLSAADLESGKALSDAEMNRHAQKLVDTAVFSAVAFKFDGQDLIFQLTPADGLLPLRLQNLPLAAGKDLDEKLHRQFPLYHGLLPQQGGLTESVRAALAQMLATQNINATVIATPFRDAALNKTTAVNFAITAPPVLVGELRTEGAIVALDPKASALLAQFPGTPYDAHRTAEQIETSFITYYKDQGYPEPSIHATVGTKPSITLNAIRVPLRISILPGAQFKLAGIHIASGLLISQTDFDRESRLHPGDIPDGARLRAAWQFVERRYHEQGYIKATVRPTAAYDQSSKTVSYTVSVDPGPVYTMGNLTIDNVTDDLRKAMLAAWKLPAGSVFNETVISAFFSSHGVNPALEQAFAGINYKYFLHPNDEAHTVDLTLALERKP